MPQILPKVLLLFQGSINIAEGTVNKYIEILKNFPEIQCIDMELVKEFKNKEIVSKDIITQFTSLYRKQNLDIDNRLDNYIKIKK